MRNASEGWCGRLPATGYRESQETRAAAGRVAAGRQGQVANAEVAWRGGKGTPAGLA